VKKVIVIGGSTGAIQVLCQILEGLPADLDAAVLAVIRISQQGSLLPVVLERCRHYPVSSPARAEPIKAGKVFIAAPNRHLIVRSHCAVSWMGPRENRHRPGIDPLFRSAARTYGNHVIAVILSGLQDDGVLGALAVKARGGVVIVQDPDESMASDMPRNVLRAMKPDLCLKVGDIPAQLKKMTRQGPAIKSPKISAEERAKISKQECLLEPFGLTCPECGGVIITTGNGWRKQYRCHVGHIFSRESFTEAHADALERALWAALRKLNEQRSIQYSLAKDHTLGTLMRKRHRENGEAAELDMQLLHEILLGL